MRALIEMSDVSVSTPSGRPLFDALNLRIGHEHVALIGRNGVGKSTLLAILAGVAEADSGRVKTRSKPHFVPQADEQAEPLSLGELRQRTLTEAQRSGAEILLLDEPTEHLDDDAVCWLRAWLHEWPGCLIVASHDRRLLADFRHFFVISESGCRYFGGRIAELDAELERDHQGVEQRYVRNLNRLATQEEHTQTMARRNARKKRNGRFKELDRATPRIRLNERRAQAQASHARLAKLSAERLASLRRWTRSTRRALNVTLSLELRVPTLATKPEQDVVILQGVSAAVGGRVLFEGLELRLGRQRVMVVGPNGAGKTTLLDIVLGRRQPSAGSAVRDLSKIGWIEQGGANWMLEVSLLSQLELLGATAEDAAQLLVSHKFPLALGERPLRSLSPGERTRAALICLFARSPAVEVLVLDEPTFSLDLVGQRALGRALSAWPGGLVVASHDRDFLSQLSIDRVVQLGAGRRVSGVTSGSGEIENSAQLHG